MKAGDTVRIFDRTTLYEVLDDDPMYLITLQALDTGRKLVTVKANVSVVSPLKLLAEQAE